MDLTALVHRLRNPLYQQMTHVARLAESETRADMSSAADALEALVAERDRYKAALETIAENSQDGLKALQAKSALANIGAKVEPKA